MPALSIQTLPDVDSQLLLTEIADDSYYIPATSGVLCLRNTTSSSIEIIISSDTGNIDCADIGIGVFDASGGYRIIIHPESTQVLFLESIYKRLTGNAYIIGGTAGLYGCVIQNVTSIKQLSYAESFIYGGRLISSGKLTNDSRLWG